MHRFLCLALVSTTFFSCREDHSSEIEALEQRLAEIEGELMELKLSDEKKVQLLDQNRTMISSAIEEQQKSLGGMDVAIKLLNDNESTASHREVILPLDEEAVLPRVIKTELGDRVVISLQEHKVDAKAGVVQASVILTNPQAYPLEGVRFFARAHTHDLVNNLRKGEGQTEYLQIDTGIDLPAGKATSLTFPVQWQESDSPIVGVQLKDLFIMMSTNEVEE